MALHTRKQFAILCNLDPSKDSERGIVNMNIKRKKLVLSGDFLDDTIPENRDFITKQKDRIVKPNDNWEVLTDTSIKNIITRIEDVKPEKKTPKTPNTQRKNDSSNEGVYGLEKILKTQQLEKLEVETRLLNLKEQKILGEIISIDLVKQLFITHNQSFLTLQKTTIDEILLDFAKEANLSADKVSKLRGRIVSILNNGIERTIETTKKNMSALLSEFSIKRDVGEHD